MKLLFWLNRARSTIYCRITVRGVRVEISTGIKVQHASLWDSAQQRLDDKLGDIKLLDMEMFFKRMELLTPFVTAEKLKEAWGKRNHENAKPTPFLLSAVKERAGKGQNALANYLKSYNKTNGNVRFHQLTQPWADGFARHLEENVKQSSARIYIKLLRATINLAISKYKKGDEYPEMITEIPFKGPEVRTDSSRVDDSPKYLTLQHYEDLKELKLTDSDDFYRQCFLFQCATGMSFIDFKKFNYLMFINDIKGNKYIKYERTKTHMVAIIPLCPETTLAMHSIGDWTEVRKMNERTYNRRLKELGAQIGFENMTSHNGRHTFGVMKLIEGYSMESVCKMMGHGSIRTTEKIYAQVTIDKLFKEKREITYGED